MGVVKFFFRHEIFVFTFHVFTVGGVFIVWVLSSNIDPGSIFVRLFAAKSRVQIMPKIDVLFELALRIHKNLNVKSVDFC